MKLKNKKTKKRIIQIVITAMACGWAYIDRGYIAVGSEFLLIPLIYFMNIICKGIYVDLRENHFGLEE